MNGGPLPTTGPGAGVPLTRFERRRVDFTETTVVHARWCKAAAYENGVDDWLAHYDRALTVDEHRAVYARVSADPKHGPTLRATPDELLGAPRR